jgi:endonuclease YncB( thermonuclease family)
MSRVAALLAFASLVALPSPGEAARRTVSRGPDLVDQALARVVALADGDTLTVVPQGGDRRVKVRVLGVDCPETKANRKCGHFGARPRLSCADELKRGALASARARTLLEGRSVRVESAAPGAPIRRDVYGRSLAYVRLLDGRDFGRLLIEAGLCADFGWKYPHPRSAEYVAAGSPR